MSRETALYLNTTAYLVVALVCYCLTLGYV